jgi:hypothetical protein
VIPPAQVALDVGFCGGIPDPAISAGANRPFDVKMVPMAPRDEL